MKYLTIILITMISLSTFAQDMEISTTENQYALKGEIVNIRTDSGVIMITLVTSKNEKVKSMILDIENNRCSFDFGILDGGDYVINYMHDENGNKEFDSNFMGIPTEGYGFSNNATAMFSAPDFKDRIFTLNEDKSLDLKIKYML